MNFYSVNGNNYDNQVYQNFNNQNIETFENIEYNVSSQSDDSYQCSDNYIITGENMFSGNLSVDLCKKSCQSDVNCVSFDYNNNTKTCNLYKNVESLSTPDSNSFFCIRKKSGMCKVNKTESNTKVEEPEKTEETEKIKIIGEIKKSDTKVSSDLNELKARLDILNSLVSQNSSLMESIQGINKGLTTIDNKFVNAQTIQQELSDNLKLFNTVKAENEEYKREIDKYNTMIKELEIKLSKKCDRDNIYVDLNCYLGKMETLKNHSENMMVDLSILASNIKSCSYINKVKSQPVKTISLTDQLLDKIIIPKPEEVNILNELTNNTISTVPIVPTLPTKITEEIESFANVGPEYQFKWLSSDLLIVIGILFIFWIIIFQRKK